ncbi:MAG: YggT family protein [Caulobacter sp.]|nr:YggT family protein [Caulobacter sp.]RYG88300.1 MAG: YggT family protein [Alphaproteobacteria bacterium]
MGDAIYWLINAIINLIIFTLIIQAVISWLVAFNVINLSHPVARQVVDFLDAVTAPMLRPLRRIVPRLGGVDLSPIVLILLLGFVRVLFNATIGRALLQGF